VTLADSLPLEAVRTRAHAADWREAIRLAGDGLVAGGATTDEYTQEMIDTVERLGPYIVIAPGFALAHSRPSPAVLRTGLSWVSLAEPVEFGSEQNDPVSVVVGLAATDHDGHIGMMAELAGAIGDEALFARLKDAETPEQLLEELRAAGSAAQDAATPPEGETP